MFLLQPKRKQSATVRTIKPPPGSDLYFSVLQAYPTLVAQINITVVHRLRLDLDAGDYTMSCDVGGPLLGDSADELWKSLIWLEVLGKSKDETRIIRTKACSSKENTGPQKRRFFTVKSGACLRLSGLTLSGGDANGYLKQRFPKLPADPPMDKIGRHVFGDTNWGGGVLFLDGSAGVIENSELTNNSANDGGAIRVNMQANLTITDSVISHNNATGSAGSGGNGGGVNYYQYGSWSNNFGRVPTARVTGVKFIQNQANQDGGGLYMQGTRCAEVKELIFVSNAAKARGGGLTLYLIEQGFGVQHFSSLLLKGNQAEQYGGGMHIDSDEHASSSEFVNVTARSNRAPGGGGISMHSLLRLYPAYGPIQPPVPFKVTVRDSLVESNVAYGQGAEASGGGFRVSCGQYLISKTMIRNNTAETCGGGVSQILLSTQQNQTNCSWLTLNSSSVSKNRAGDVHETVLKVTTQLGYGGGVCAQAQQIASPVNLGFKSCPVPNSLGGSKPVSNCTSGQPWQREFSCKCTPIEDEFALWEYAMRMKIQATNISFNSASFGGAISNRNGYLNISDGSVVQWNLGLEGGGGVYQAQGSGSLELDNMIMKNNRGKTAHTLGLGIQSLATGPLIVSGTTQLFLGGNASEMHVAVGAGKIDLAPTVQIRCPIGYRFAENTQLTRPYRAKHGTLWEINCDNAKCRETCAIYNPQSYNSDQFNPQKQTPGNLECMRRCNQQRCSRNDGGKADITSPYNRSISLQEYGQKKTEHWAYYSSCQFCQDASALQPYMLTQFFNAGCEACPPNSYSLDTSNCSTLGKTGDRLHVEQLVCLECPTHAYCPGGPMVLAAPGYYGIINNAQPRAIANGESDDDTGQDRAVPQVQMLQCPASYCNKHTPQPSDAYHVDADNNMLPGRSPGIGDCSWHLSTYKANNSWTLRSCLHDSNRDPQVLLCGWCKQGFSQSFPGTTCVADDKCSAVFYYSAVVAFLALVVVVYCLAAGANEKDTGRLQTIIFFYQLAPSFEGAAGTAVTTFMSGLAMANGYATTESSTGFGFCLYPGFSMIGKLGFMSFMPPLLSFILMIVIGRRLARPTQKLVSWLQSGQQLIEKKFVRLSLTKRQGILSNTSELEDGLESKDVRFSRAFVKLWFLYFATLGQALATLTQCTDKIDNSGRHLLLATEYACAGIQAPAAVCLVVLWMPSTLLLFLRFLRDRPESFFEFSAAKVLRLRRLRNWAARVKKEGAVIAIFAEPDEFYKPSFTWWPHFAALFRVFVVTAKFLFYMKTIQLYVLLIILGLFWLAAVTLCRPFKSQRANQLAVIAGSCWILITGLGELISEDVALDQATDKTLLTVMSSMAALAPAIMFMLTYRISDISDNTNALEMANLPGDGEDIEITSSSGRASLDYELMHGPPAGADTNAADQEESPSSTPLPLSMSNPKPSIADGRLDEPLLPAQTDN